MLKDLTVFSEFLYTSATEVLTQQVDLFNDASQGALTLQTQKHIGDFADTVSFAKVPGGLVRRRDAYGNGNIPVKHMSHLDETMVKVAAGTPVVELTPSQWDWIQQSPDVAAATMALQMSKDMMADMVNTAVGAVAVALAGQTNHVNDISALTGNAPGYPTTNPYPSGFISPLRLNDTVARFGDAASQLRCWVMHSGPMFQLFGNQLQNQSRLFDYGSVGVLQDGFGRRYISADVPALVQYADPLNPAGQAKYITLGLCAGAVRVDQQDDFRENFDVRNGQENIQRTYQAEWSYMLGVNGFAWDKANGGKSPTDAAIMSGANWDRIVTSDKSLPGVVLVSAKLAA